MKRFAYGALVLVTILANNYLCDYLGKREGKVLGCQYAYRDLYTKYGIKHIDEDSLKSFCEKQ